MPSHRLPPALLPLLLLAACDVDAPPGSTGGVDLPPGQCGRGLVVIGSNYSASNVALLDPSGQVRSASVLSSGAGATGLSTPLSGNVVAPTERPASGQVVLIDRYPNSVLTWLDPSTGAVRAQLSVATGFGSTPMDYLEVSPTRAYVSRLNPSPAPGAEPFDGGSDVLVIDPTVPAIVDRIAFDEEPPPPGEPAYAARPAGMAAAADAVWVALERLNLDYTRGRDGAIAVLDPATGAVRRRVELAGLANCTALGASPDRGRVAVTCTGVIDPGAGPGEQLARSGLVVLDATASPPVELRRLPGSALGSAPPPDIAPAFASSDRLLLTLNGDVDLGVPDRLVEVDLASDSVREVLRSPHEPFTLGQVRCAAPCAAACFLADAGAPGLRRLTLDAAGGASAGDLIAVASDLGLPPRALGGFLVSAPTLALAWATMSIRIASLLATAPPAGGELIGQLRERLGGDPALVVAFASPAHDLERLLGEAQASAPGAVVLGASSAGEFCERGSAKGAVSLLALGGDVVAHGGIGHDLKADPEGAVGRALAAVPPAPEGYAHRTGLVLFDALAGHGEETTLLAAMMLGSATPLVGGAAGDDLRMERTRVGLGARTAADAVAAVVLSTRTPVGIGVCHGHTPLSDPLWVTRSEGARVITIEGRPAWEVWCAQTAVAAAAHGIDPARLSDDEVGAYLLRYEAGIAAGQSFKIRAPLRRLDDGSLLFASEVPEGTRLRITESDPDRQIASARAAARQARERLGGAAPAGALIFDCVCRGLILGDRFEQAIDTMHQELDDAPFAGFETYGEIALGTSDLSGFHNTTSVVMALGR